MRLFLILILNITFLLLSLWGTPASALKKTYIVYMGEHSDDGLQFTKELLRSRTDSHIEFLGSLLGCKKKAKDAIFYSYRRYINGFAAELEEDEVAAIENSPNVVSVIPNEPVKLLTSHSWDFLSFEKNGVIPSDSLWRKAKFGEDIIIGNIDGGVWPESASFSDDAYGPIPSRWKGRCDMDDRGSPFPCNRKLIGAQSFYHGAERAGHNITLLSPRDYGGHGTHTLSTAGGNFVPGASVLGMFNGTGKGGSPRARVAAYKVCWHLPDGEEPCYGADIFKAFDRAIADGVDVISISLGFPSVPYFKDTTAIGALNAVKRGITVVASAGNDGPESGTVTNVAPWIITVAASSTDRDFLAYVQLQNGVRLQGTSISKPLSQQRMYPLVSGAHAKAANASAGDATLCVEGSLDPEKVRGTILVCVDGEIDRVLKGKHAADSGAVGMILCHATIDYDLTPSPHLLPAIELTYTDCLSIFSYINNTISPNGFLTSPKAEFGTRPAPYVASFSSRGPNTLTPAILKPDITAPGVSIMAAYPDVVSPSELDSDKRSTKYMFMSGTSMSCPHVAGIAGLLKAIHPEWSPAAIRSAIMTTATTIDNTNQPIQDDLSGPATPFSYGAGHVRPHLAADPGLVYDLSMKDYRNFLGAVGYNNKSERTHFPNKINLLDFNYPSITVPTLSTAAVTVNRVVKNVGSPGLYVAQIREPLGVSISVWPTVLRFKKLGRTRRFRLTISKKSTSITSNQYVFGELIWSDGKHNVRSPIVIRNND